MKHALAFLVAAAVVSIACAAGRSAGYGAELELCREVSNDCPRYVACRKSVAKKYSRPFSGHCADGGVE